VQTPDRTWGFTITATVSAWIRTTGVNGTVLALSRGSYEDELLLLVWGSGNIAVFNHKSGGNYWYRSSATAVNTGQWVHVAAVLDGGGTPDRLHIYVNGVEETGSWGTSGSPSAISDILSRALTIGRRHGGSEPFVGQIDDVQLRNRALSASEIRAEMYARLTGTEPGLVGYWPMQEGTGTSAADASGNGNTGTLSGGGPAAQPTWAASAAESRITRLSWTSTARAAKSTRSSPEPRRYATTTTPPDLVRGGSLATASLRPDPPRGNCPPAAR